MKETGVIRRIDELGRIVIPKEIRKRLRVGPGDMLDIYTSNKEIILSKYTVVGEFNEHLTHLLDALKKDKIDFLVASSSEVIASTTKEIKPMEELSLAFLDLFLKNGTLELSKENKVEIVPGTNIKRYVYGKKIYHLGDLFAVIIILSDNPLMKSEYDALSVIEKYLLNYVSKIA